MDHRTPDKISGKPHGKSGVRNDIPIWNIENIEMYPNAVIEIYSRSGEQVFRRRNYQNSFELGFSGNDKNGDPLPSATYYYIIDLSNEDQILKGAITIVR